MLSDERQLNDKRRRRHRSLTAVLAWVMMAGMLLPLVEAAFPPLTGCALECYTSSGICCCTGLDEEDLAGGPEIGGVRLSTSCPANCALPPSGSSLGCPGSAVTSWTPLELPRLMVLPPATRMRSDGASGFSVGTSHRSLLASRITLPCERGLPSGIWPDF